MSSLYSSVSALTSFSNVSRNRHGLPDRNVTLYA